jgi:ribosomal protein L13E
MSASSKKQPKSKGAPAKGKGKNKAKVKAKAKVTKVKKAQKVEKVEKKAPAAVEEKLKKAAPKPKQTEERKEAPPKTTEKPQPVKLGPPPTAMVVVRHVDSLHERAARGFSFGELSSAGIPLNAAKRQDLSVDLRRRSVVEQNVEALRGWFKHPGHASAPKVAVKQVAAAAAVVSVSKKK